MTPAAISLALAALLSIAGCSSTRNAVEGGTVLDRVAIERQTSPVYETLHPRLDIVANGDGTYSFIFSAGTSGASDSPQMRLMRGITSITFTVHDATGTAIDSLSTTDIPASGVMGSEGTASLTATARVEWTPKSSLVPPVQVVMRAVGDQGVIVRIADVPIAIVDESSGSRLALSLSGEQRAGMMEFVLEVERMAPSDPEEYMPSGEQFRIEIFGEHGERIWSSSSGKMFIQALGPVLPASVGERATYRATFDGRNDETRAPLAPGRYSVVATIPAKPSPYVLREELTWSGR